MEILYRSLTFLANARPFLRTIRKIVLQQLATTTFIIPYIVPHWKWVEKLNGPITISFVMPPTQWKTENGIMRQSYRFPYKNARPEPEQIAFSE